MGNEGTRSINLGSLLMKPPIVVNESQHIERPGSIDVFRSVSRLESYFEPWYVNESHFIFDSEGLQLKLEASGKRLTLSPKIPQSRHPELVRKYLVAFLNGIAAAKGWNSVKIERQSIDSASLEQLERECMRFAQG